MLECGIVLSYETIRRWAMKFRPDYARRLKRKFKKNGHRAARRGLAPLDAAARDASRIDMDSLNQRFPEGEMPIEVLPFVKGGERSADPPRRRRRQARALHRQRRA